MRKFILLFSLLFCFMYSFCQSFEGEVVYSIKYKSKLPGLTDEQLTDLAGDRQEYFIKQGKYKSVMNGHIITMQLYDDVENRIYNKTPKSDTLYWFSASVNNDTVVKYEMVRADTVLLGKKCNILKVYTASGVSTYYYSSEYAIDSNRFIEHKYGNWGFYVGKTGAISLKMVVDNKQFFMESVAVEIKALALKDSFFEVPSQTPTKQSK